MSPPSSGPSQPPVKVALLRRDSRPRSWRGSSGLAWPMPPGMSTGPWRRRGAGGAWSRSTAVRPPAAAVYSRREGRGQPSSWGLRTSVLMSGRWATWTESRSLAAPPRGSASCPPRRLRVGEGRGSHLRRRGRGREGGRTGWRTTCWRSTHCPHRSPRAVRSYRTFPPCLHTSRARLASHARRQARCSPGWTKPASWRGPHARNSS